MDQVLNDLKAFFAEKPDLWASFCRDAGIKETLLSNYNRSAQLWLLRDRDTHISRVFEHYTSGRKQRFLKALETYDNLESKQRLHLSKQSLLIFGCFFAEHLRCEEGPLAKAEWLLASRSGCLMGIASDMIREYPFDNIPGHTNWDSENFLIQWRAAHNIPLQMELLSRLKNLVGGKTAARTVEDYMPLCETIDQNKRQTRSRVSVVRNKLLAMQDRGMEPLWTQIILITDTKLNDILADVARDDEPSDNLLIVEQIIGGKTSTFIECAREFALKADEYPPSAALKEMFIKHLCKLVQARLQCSERCTKYFAFREYVGMAMLRKKKPTRADLEEVHNAIDRFEAEIWNGGKTTLSAEELDLLHN